MRDELRAREGHLHLYVGVLVLSMGNDLVTANRWDNISEGQFVEAQPALRNVISGIAELLYPPSGAPFTTRSRPTARVR